jgi:hypothetical protein
MDRNVWQPVVIRNTATETHAGASITGEVSILGVTNSSSDDDGALFRVDGLQISEGTFPATFVGPEQVRKAGEISWVIGD